MSERVGHEAHLREAANQARSRRDNPEKREKQKQIKNSEKNLAAICARENEITGVTTYPFHGDSVPQQSRVRLQTTTPIGGEE